MEETKLIVLRGPSGSGKSSAARAVRDAQKQKTAIVEQDYLRRIVLKEKDIPNGLNIELIKKTTLFLLDNSYNVIMEGIFDSDRYGEMLKEIIAEHPNNNYFFYFNISLEETIRRHQYKPNKDEFGEKELRRWYKENDLLNFVQEESIAENLSLEQIVERILVATGNKYIGSYFR
ncbi:MAG: kinase [Candidatus Andersenbacteria bacterium]|nr:kinase [Candidatus Andersenbacteria bacterium]